jgi:hypothetical protein
VRREQFGEYGVEVLTPVKVRKTLLYLLDISKS